MFSWSWGVQNFLSQYLKSINQNMFKITNCTLPICKTLFVKTKGKWIGKAKAGVGKLFLTHTSNKGLMTKIYKEFPLNNSKKTTQWKYQEKILTDSYKTRYLNGQYSMKRYPTPLIIREIKIKIIMYIQYTQ